MKPFVPALCLLTVSVACSPPDPITQASSLPLLPDIASYRTWTRVTKEPYAIDAGVAMLCIGWPGFADMFERLPQAYMASEMQLITDSKKHGVHWNYLVHVYVNEIGRKTLVRHGGVFPEGTIIVKEKYPSKYVSFGKAVLEKIEAITVMRKREPGFDSKNGNWEYLVGNPQNNKVVPAQGKQLESCQSCHSHYKDRDFVTKAYLLTNQDMFATQTRQWRRQAK